MKQLYYTDDVCEEEIHRAVRFERLRIAEELYQTAKVNFITELEYLEEHEDEDAFRVHYAACLYETDANNLAMLALYGGKL